MGELVGKWCWQGKTQVLGEERVRVAL